MWAAFKSDLKEFATGAAEETNVVAERVVGARIIRTAADVDDDDDDDDVGGGGGGGVVAGGSAVLSSIGERGLRGLNSVSSMMGGIVAPQQPRSPPVFDDAKNGGGGGVSSSRGLLPASTALTSMLAAAVSYGDGDDDEEELGWDDDDDDDDKILDAGDEDDDGVNNVVAPPRGDVAAATTATTITTAGPKDPRAEDAVVGDNVRDDATVVDEDDLDALRAMRNKLAIVEKSRNELQVEHRRQTAELVELRSKVEEIERERRGEEGDVPFTTDDDEREGEVVRALRLQIEDLKSRLDEKIKGLSEEHEGLVESILREKEGLDRELIEQRRLNEELAKENRTLLERGGGDEELLRAYQLQIRELESDLASARADLDSASSELIGIKKVASNREEYHREEMKRPERLVESPTLVKEERVRADAGEEVEEYKSKSAEVDERVRSVGAESGSRKSELMEFEERVRVEIDGPKPSEFSEHSGAAALAAESTDETAHEDDAVPSPTAVKIAKESSSDSCVHEKKESSPSHSSDSSPVKLEAEDELSDDWGDGGWGDDDP